MSVTGLDAVDALDLAEKVIVIAHRLTVIGERRSGEVTVLAWKPLLDRASEQGLIARRCQLPVIGQARGVEINRSAHSECVGLLRHHVSELALATADSLGDN